MKDFFKNVRECIDEYNRIQDKIATSAEETTDEEDEFYDDFSLYLAHALLKDAGDSVFARKDLEKMANIIEYIISYD